MFDKFKTKEVRKKSQNKIVVAHFLFNFGLGGMGSGVLKLVNNFNRKKYQHVIITLCDELALSKRINDPSVSIRVIPGKSVVARIVGLLRIIKQERIDILHARGWPTMLEAAIVRFFYPHLINIFSFHGRSYDELNGIKFRRWILQIFLVRMYKQIITLTESMQNEITQEFLISKQKIKIVRNGVYQNGPLKLSKKLLRAEFKIDKETFVVGFVGRIDPVKNIETIIEAFNTFYERSTAGFLFIVGDGKQLTELKQMTSRLNCAKRVLFTGSRDNGPELMAGFDVYLQTSLYEGLSNTILEAMALGLPVICTRVGGNIDLIKDGKNGYLIEKNDSMALADHIDTLYHDAHKRREMGALNKAKISELHTVSQMVSGYERIYSELL